MRLVRRIAGVALGHRPLHLDGAAHRVDDAAELDQHPVAGGLDDAAAMLGDAGSINSLRCAFRRAACLLVLAHQPAVARDIGRQDRRQPALDPLRSHGGPPEIAGSLRRCRQPINRRSCGIARGPEPAGLASPRSAMLPLAAASAAAYIACRCYIINYRDDLYMPIEQDRGTSPNSAANPRRRRFSARNSAAADSVKSHPKL